MEFDFFEEQMFLATTLVEVKDIETGDSWQGTGFLVRHPLPPPDTRNAAYLVSCRHVLAARSGLIRIKLHYKDVDSTSGQPKYGRAIAGFDPYTNTYFAHPDLAIDLACVNISRLLVDMAGTEHIKMFTVDQFLDFASDVVGPTMDAYFVGYPLGFYDSVTELPICRAGVIASLPRMGFQGRRTFLIDAQVHRSTSGAPVLVRTGGQLKLAGVLTGTLASWEPVQVPIDDQGEIKYRKISADLGRAVQVPAALGEVLRVDVLREMLDAATRRLAEKSPPPA
jgi:hypothetical protein